MIHSLRMVNHTLTKKEEEGRKREEVEFHSISFKERA